jgi:hypothetical protein
MNMRRRRHIGGYSQTGWEIQTTWKRKRKVAKAGLMASIDPGDLRFRTLSARREKEALEQEGS